jgi:hypothetical protein
VTAPAPSMADLFPIRQARFVNGRTWHRVKQPTEWADVLEAACGKSGYQARGYTANDVRECASCAKAVAPAA